MSESESEGSGSEELPDVGELFRGLGRTKPAVMLNESDKPRSKTTQPKKKKARSSEEVIVLD